MGLVIKECIIKDLNMVKVFFLGQMAVSIMEIFKIMIYKEWDSIGKY